MSTTLRGFDHQRAERDRLGERRYHHCGQRRRLDQGGNGADQLIAGTGPSSQDTFVYAAFTESNLNLGYDTVAGFKIGTDKIDISGLFTNPACAALRMPASPTLSIARRWEPPSIPRADLAIGFISTRQQRGACRSPTIVVHEALSYCSLARSALRKRLDARGFRMDDGPGSSSA